MGVLSVDGLFWIPDAVRVAGRSYFWAVRNLRTKLKYYCMHQKKLC